MTAMRDDVFAALQTVSALGNLYQYERWAVERDKLLAQARYADDGTERLRIFWLTLANVAPERLEFQDGASAGYLRNYTYLLRGWVGLNDTQATELTAHSLATAAMTALNTDTTLHGATYYETTPASLTVFEPRTFYGILTHYIEVTVTVRAYNG